MIEHRLLPIVPETVLDEIRTEPLNSHVRDFETQQADVHGMFTSMNKGLYDYERDEVNNILGFTYTALNRTFLHKPGFFPDLAHLPTLDMPFVTKELTDMLAETPDLRVLRVQLGEAFLKRQEALAQEVGGLCIDKGFSDTSMLQFASSGGMLAEILERGLANLWQDRFTLRASS